MSIKTASRGVVYVPTPRLRIIKGQWPWSGFKIMQEHKVYIGLNMGQEPATGYFAGYKWTEVPQEKEQTL